jgi:hypothetical protein
LAAIPGIEAIERQTGRRSSRGDAAGSGVHDRAGEFAIEHERIRERPERCIEERGADVLARGELDVGPPAGIDRESFIGG